MTVGTNSTIVGNNALAYFSKHFAKSPSGNSGKFMTTRVCCPLCISNNTIAVGNNAFGTTIPSATCTCTSPACYVGVTNGVAVGNNVFGNRVNSGRGICAKAVTVANNGFLG